MIDSNTPVIHRGAMKSYRYTTYLVNGFHFHDIEVVGPIDLETRIPLYRATARHSLPPHYFCIIDNSAGHENIVTLDDLKQLDEILSNAGIRFYYGASITIDPGYHGIVNLAHENLQSLGIKNELIQTYNRGAAEAFIKAKIDAAAAARDAGK